MTISTDSGTFEKIPERFAGNLAWTFQTNVESLTEGKIGEISVLLRNAVQSEDEAGASRIDEKPLDPRVYESPEKEPRRRFD